MHDLYKYVIDRFEGDYAVLEALLEALLESNGQAENFVIKRSLLPVESKEGDVVKEQDGIYIIDSEATSERRRMILEKMKKMRRK